MVKVGYTEFSYGYAFTENLIRSSSTAPTGAPVFPNLVQEAQLGFDINVNFPGVPLFFQFKLPEIMRKSTAFEIANWNCPGLRVPFFRIALMRRNLSRQHELLIELEQRYPNGVFYAAPHLAGIHDFDRAYNAAAIAQRSTFFSPGDIGPLPDDKAHTIAYRAHLQTAYFCSEPQEIKAQSFDALAASIRSQMDEKRFAFVEPSAREVRETVLSLASRSMRDAEGSIVDRVAMRRVLADGPAVAPEIERAATDILVAREVARVDLGVELVFAQPAA